MPIRYPKEVRNEQAFVILFDNSSRLFNAAAQYSYPLAVIVMSKLKSVIHDMLDEIENV